MALNDAQHDVVLKTMAFTLVGDVLLVCHSAAPPSDAEWNQWVQRGAKNEHRGSLAITAGGAPNSAQRARTAQVVASIEQPPPFVLLTDSTLMRSVMTAFTWLLGGKQRMKALAPSELEEALSWMGVGVRPERVREAIARLQAGLARSPQPRAAR
jgi:hypothetical protein